MASAIERPVILLISMGVVASGVAGWLVTGRLLGPLSRLTQMATALRPERLEQDESAPAVSVSELQSVQQSLRETRESLREAFRAQERFLSNVAHELKTPIAVLLAESQTIDRAVLGEEGGRFVNSVNEEMKRLGKLVESFLLLAKVHAGKALLKSEVVFINDVVMGAVEQCSIMARQYAVTLVPTLLEGDVGNATVAGDPMLLQTMIDGLIRNAIKFSPNGGRVDVVTDTVENSLNVCVRDQGPGIAPEIAPTLFDRFVQAPAESARGRGTGLGLVIAQGIAELHSGKISFENRSEGGCEFCIRLPRAQVQLDEALVGD
jgi:two-component system heavy metal sensor histidine kinase CusS